MIIEIYMKIIKTDSGTIDVYGVPLMLTIIAFH